MIDLPLRIKWPWVVVAVAGTLGLAGWVLLRGGRSPVVADKGQSNPDEPRLGRLATEALAHDPDRALVLAERYCLAERTGETEQQRCLTIWRARVAEIKAQRQSCDAQERGACSTLGRLLVAADEEAALAAFAAECRLRGIADLYTPVSPGDIVGEPWLAEWYERRGTKTGEETCGLELLKRDAAAHPDDYHPVRRESASDSGVRVPRVNQRIQVRERVRAEVRVHPDDAALRDAVNARRSIVAACLSPSAVSTGLVRAATVAEVRETRGRMPRRFSLSFVVDRFGEIPLERSSNNDLSQEEHECIVRAHHVAYPAPDSGRMIGVDYTFEPTF